MSKIDEIFKKMVLKRIESEEKNFGSDDVVNNIINGKYLRNFLNPKPTDHYYDNIRKFVSSTKAEKIITELCKDYLDNISSDNDNKKINLDELDADLELKDKR